MTSPTTIDGIVQSVQRVTLGDELAADAAGPFGKDPGTTSLVVDDAIDFDPDGGNLTINGQTIAYTAADDATSTITLATGLTAAGAIGDRVDVTDANGVVLTELRAIVELAEPVDNDEALDVPVAHALVPLLAEGVRDPGTGESVRLTLHGDEWVLTDVVARPPQIDGALIKPSTIGAGALSFTVGSTTVTIDTVAPASPHVGDLWLDGSNGYQIKQWDGASWVAHQLGAAAIGNAAITPAQVSFSARDIGGVTTSIGSVAPSSPLAGDLWYDSSNGYQLNRYTGTGWTLVQFGAQAIQDASITAAKVNLTARQIGANTTTIANAAPGGAIAGDMWLDPTNGYRLSQYTGAAWTLVQFGAAALATASITPDRISFTARDIGGVTTTIAAAAPSGALAGDLWYDSSNGYRLNRYASGAWTAVQLGTSAIAAGSITAALIAANTITAAQIAAGTITAAQIAANTITAGQIAADTITAAQIAAGAITTSELAAGAVTAAAIAANTITAAQIAAGTITAAQIAASTITAGQIAANTITAAQIAAGTITGDRITAGTITAGLIAAGTITGDRIAAGTITGGLIAAGAIAAGHILAGSISADKLAVGALDAQSITAASIFAGNFTGTIQGTPTEPTSIIGAQLTDCTIEMDSTSGPLLVHGSAGAPTVNTYAASASFTPPAGVTSIKVEAWGAGGSGQPGFAGQGGGGGEYARNDSVPVTPGTVYNFTVAGTAVANIGFASGTDGGNTTFTGDSGVVVKANGGKGGYSSVAGAGAGGSGSTAPVHFNGGTAPDSSASTIWSGQGGGGSGGSSRAGNAGKEPAASSYTGGAGGVAVTDGGAGGKGGDGTDGTGTHPGSAGTAGAVPGGGGGGGSYNQSYATLNGGNGARGQLRITYTVAIPPLLASISPVAGTDQYGNTYPAGVHDAVTATVQTVAIGTPLNGAGLGGVFAPPTLYFVKDSNDIVTFWGYGWINAALTANTAYNVATLPAGFRPAYNFTFPSVTSMTGQTTGRIQIYSNGQVTYVPSTSSTATGNNVSITGSYKAGN